MTLPLIALRRVAKQEGEDSVNIWQTSDLERYSARPDDTKFKGMCLAAFVSQYKLSQASTAMCSDDDHNHIEDDNNPNNDEDHDGDTNQNHKQPVRLQESKGYVKERKTPCIIRNLRVSLQKDSERQFENLLRLFLPPPRQRTATPRLSHSWSVL